MSEARRLECETIQLLPQDVGSRISAFLHEPDPLPWAPGVAPARVDQKIPLEAPNPRIPKRTFRLSRGVGPLVSSALPPALQFTMAASSSRDTPQPAASASRGAPQPASEACELKVGSFNIGFEQGMMTGKSVGSFNFGEASARGSVAPVRRLRAALGDDGQWVVGHWQRFVRKLLGIHPRARRAQRPAWRWRIRHAWNRSRWRKLLRHWRVRYLL